MVLVCEEVVLDFTDLGCALESFKYTFKFKELQVMLWLIPCACLSISKYFNQVSDSYQSHLGYRLEKNHMVAMAWEWMSFFQKWNVPPQFCMFASKIKSK